MITDKNGKELKIDDEVKTDDNMRFTIKRFNNFGGAECASDLQPLWVFLPTELTLFSSAECILTEPNKPVQYVVELGQPDLSYGIEIYSAYMNGQLTVSGCGISEIKDLVFLHINKIRRFLSLPAITIDQITFVEI